MTDGGIAPSVDGSLAAAVALRRLADRVEADAVRRGVAEGWNYADLAEALGVTKQAVHKKYAHTLRGDRA